MNVCDTATADEQNVDLKRLIWIHEDLPIDLSGELDQSWNCWFKSHFLCSLTFT